MQNAKCRMQNGCSAKADHSLSRCGDSSLTREPEMWRSKVQSVALLIIVIMLISSLGGCAKLVDVKEEKVQVQIVDSYYKPQWTQIVPTGKTFATIVYPAQYRITVRYGDYEYGITDRKTYNWFKSKIGEYADAILTIKTYDNGRKYGSIRMIMEE